MIELQDGEFIKCTCCEELMTEDQIEIVNGYKCEKCGDIYEDKFEAENCCLDDNEDDDEDDVDEQKEAQD